MIASLGWADSHEQRLQEDAVAPLVDAQRMWLDIWVAANHPDMIAHRYDERSSRHEAIETAPKSGENLIVTEQVRHPVVACQHRGRGSCACLRVRPRDRPPATRQ